MMDSSKKSDALIMAEAVRLVGEGVSVTFPVNGCSMLPFIVGGCDSVILEKPENLRVGDVVLAHAIPDNVALLENAEKRYVIHRIVALSGENVVLMGDGNLVQREYCKRSEVCAKVVCVVKPNGKKCLQGTFAERSAAKIWYILLPLRRYLLWFYRKMKK
ncbi:S24/S26 family peptidase [Fibrobacter sp. UBA4297]|uniref:S24/S26 family peptidase n=1 Tax=Fibrobacter sp. UBA4297 TaxID=1946536 RepID=UPI0025C71FC7|nr:S24/S26 family peptidase [Fibrobacter sp. UBA4297]